MSESMMHKRMKSANDLKQTNEDS